MDSIAQRTTTAAPDIHRRDLRLWLGLVFVIPLFGPLQTANAQCVESDILRSTRAARDGQGSAVAVSGNVVLVGSPQRSHAGHGFVSFFRYDGTSWVEEAYQPPHDLHHGGTFGAAVAVDGDVAVIGASSHGHDWLSSPSGAAFVYRFDRATSIWKLERELSADWKFAKFGASVAIAGDVIVVGAPLSDNDNSLSDSIVSGRAYIYRFVHNEWVLEKTLTDPLPRSNEGDFGHSVAVAVRRNVPRTDALRRHPVREHVVLVGAPNRGDDDRGVVYVYRSNYWALEARLHESRCSDTLNVTGKHFGISISVDGKRALIGRPGSSSSRRSGAAFVFRDDGRRGWTCEASLTPPVRNHRFGRAVALDGRVAIVAGVVPGPSPSGAVWAYERRGGVWGPRICELIGSNLGGVVESFGVSVDLHRDRAVAGATPITSVGGAYVFDGMADGIPESCEPCSFTCPWDLDCDGDVDVSDFIFLILVWGFDYCGPADFDGDGNVGMADLLALLAHWGPCP